MRNATPTISDVRPRAAPQGRRATADPASVSVKRLLIIAFQFPPFALGSGYQRSLRFVQHLPRFGWEALVLSAHPRAFEVVDDDLIEEVPRGTVVERAFALDTARHLAIGGVYPERFARPDRNVSWYPGAVMLGRRMLRKHRPHAILSTYPIATAHMIGRTLARMSGLPWVADFRDPMAQEGYPADPRTWASFKRIEEGVFDLASACTFTTPSAAQMYRERYPETSARIEVIENGYDEETFASVAPADVAAGPLNRDATTLLHSGIVYPEERDPTQLFAALAMLRSRGIDGRRLRVRFRAPEHDELLRDLARRYEVESMVDVMPRVRYQEAVVEMLRADGLLVLQAANCNAQIPAKLYEYLRAGRPILALTDPAGDTAAVMCKNGVNAIARLDNAAAIADLLARFVAGDRSGMVASSSAVSLASRSARADELAKLLDSLAAAG